MAGQKTAQQIDDYKGAGASLSYSFAEQLKHLNDLNILYSAKNPALERPIYNAEEDMKHIRNSALSVSHSEL